MSRKSVITLALLLAAAPVFTQTAAEMERILSVPAVSYTDAAWLVLSAAEAVPAGTTAGNAYRTAEENQWLSKKAASQKPLTLGELSFLIMKSFNMKGGLFYTLFPGPRYSYRELIRLNLIPGRAYSGLAVSGERLLQILGGVLSHNGEE
jgi:hypothetical protein